MTFSSGENYFFFVCDKNTIKIQTDKNKEDLILYINYIIMYNIFCIFFNNIFKDMARSNAE